MPLGRSYFLILGVTGGEFPCGVEQQGVFLGKFRHEQEVVLGLDIQALRLAAVDAVDGPVGPWLRGYFARQDFVLLLVLDVELHIARVAQAVFSRVENLVVEAQRGDDAHAGLVVFGLVSQSHGVHQVLLVVVELRGDGDIVELIGLVALRIVAVDAHIGHLSVGDVEQAFGIPVLLIVLLVFGVGKREFGREAQTVRYLVVEVHQRGDSVEMLLDDCA